MSAQSPSPGIRGTALLAAACLLSAACASSPRTPSSLSGDTDDATIQATVKAQLLDDPRVEPDRINLEVTRGVVTLLGWVDSEEERKAIEEIAWSVRGVKDVRNELRLKTQIQGEPQS